jgi:hypothetical protein
MVCAIPVCLEGVYDGADPALPHHQPVGAGRGGGVARPLSHHLPFGLPATKKKTNYGIYQKSGFLNPTSAK